MPEHAQVRLREVGLRDGLQLTSSFPSTETKIAIIEAEYAAGVRLFEAGSFVPPSRYPQFADVRAVIDAIASLPGATATALALNHRGALDALGSGVPAIDFVVSASPEHQRRNANSTIDDAIAQLREAVIERDRGAHRPSISISVSMAFGCSIVGHVPPEDVLSIVGRCRDAGADSVMLADTVGYAGPRQIRELIDRVRAEIGDIDLGIHLHDTRGMAIANAAAALDRGVTMFDGSIGGLGGCPFAPNATGNVVLEDLAFLCQTMGHDTGIDVAALGEARALLQSALPDEQLHGALARAGMPLT
ncbi:MAG: hydroxymethylglutaryl-CoA lyase [Acidimicrobiia bacterium]